MYDTSSINVKHKKILSRQLDKLSQKLVQLCRDGGSVSVNIGTFWDIGIGIFQPIPIPIPAGKYNEKITKKYRNTMRNFFWYI